MRDADAAAKRGRQLLEVPDIKSKNPVATRFTCAGDMKEIVDAAPSPAALRAGMDR